MRSRRAFVTSTLGLGAVTLAHALLTWPLGATLALFGGGAVIAFVGEATVVSLGWLEHAIRPKLVGVPLYLLAGWTAITYGGFRVSLLVADGWVAVAVGAGLATSCDILTDHRGVQNGFWRYTDDWVGPRYRGVPWWNYAGWALISGCTAGLAVPFL